MDDPSMVVAIDDLEYGYDDGNKLLNVRDHEVHPAGFKDGHVPPPLSGTKDFEYDAYGNLVVDRNKGITDISYNHLNLPVKITFVSGGKIEYFYDAMGIKLKKKATDGTTITTTEYMDGFQYTNTKLDFFPHAEGYVKAVYGDLGGGGPPSFRYVFTYTDHLGNIRLKYTQHPQTGDTEILEENHYYPYGLTHRGYNGDHRIFKGIAGTGIELVPVTPLLGDSYKYKFGGKEYQDEFDINTYDFGARNYDPALVRTFTPDPLGEAFYHLSPYSFLNNNPLSNIDPTGALTLTGQAARDFFQGVKDDIESRPEIREKEEDFEDDTKGPDNTHQGGCPPEVDCEGMQRGNTPVPIGDFSNSSLSSNSTLSFQAGKSYPISVDSGTYIEVSAGILSVGYNETTLSYNGESIMSSSITTGGGLGFTMFSRLEGSSIEFHSNMTGNTLLNVFNQTGLVITQSGGSMLVGGRIIGFDNSAKMNKLWSATVFGGGLEGGVSSDRSTSPFKSIKK